jgi:antitoxin (DNA-binding transcriptional repressor) of toxin-antitoxin stability system
MPASKGKPLAKTKKLAKKSVYSMHEAKTNLSKLVKKALAGEEVILANGKTPVAKIVAFTEVPKRTFGSMKGRITWTENAFDPLTDEEMKELGFE